MKTIPLTKDQVALVDDEDFDYVNQYKWMATKNRHIWYATTTLYFTGGTHRKYKRKRLAMHIEIMKRYFNQIKQIDHKNHNGLDNCKHNLRLINGAENQRNMKKQSAHSSIYKGVSWNTNAHQWHSQIMFRYKGYHLGYFNNEKEAARAYDRMAINYFGEFACTNFPLNDYESQDVKSGAPAIAPESTGETNNLFPANGSNSKVGE